MGYLEIPDPIDRTMCPFWEAKGEEYSVRIMPTRDELKAIIDRMPPEKLDLVHMNLESILHPPVLHPQVEQIMRRSEELQRELAERLPQLQAGCKPETIRGFDGGGGIGCGPGLRNQGGYIRLHPVVTRQCFGNRYTMDAVEIKLSSILKKVSYRYGNQRTHEHTAVFTPED
jgi:hypothetical protein